MKQITFNQYRNIDITLLCLMTAVFEAITCVATNKWFVLQAMAISITLTMTCITAFRWSEWALIPAFVGSLSYCIASKADLKQIFIYCTGALFCILTIPLLKKLGKESVRKDFIKRSLFAIAVYVIIALSRWLLSLPFKFDFDTLVLLITTDVLSLLFAIIVLSIVKNLDGILEDQKSYLLRLDRERREIERENQSDPFNDPY